MRGLLALGLGVLFVAGVAGGGDVKTDSAKLQGKWVAEEKGLKIEMTFAKDTFTFDIAGKPFKGTYKIDPTKKPKEMDMAIKEGDMYVGKTAKTIYELKGDTLKWCTPVPGEADRAKEFPTKEENPKFMTLTFKAASSNQTHHENTKVRNPEKERVFFGVSYFRDAYFGRAGQGSGLVNGLDCRYRTPAPSLPPQAAPKSKEGTHAHTQSGPPAWQWRR